MLRTARILAKFTLVWTVIFLMTFDTVLACRWIRRRSCVCPPAPTCYMGTVVSEGYISEGYTLGKGLGKGAGGSEISPSDLHGHQVPSPAQLDPPVPTPDTRAAPAPAPESVIEEEPAVPESDVLEPTLPEEASTPAEAEAADPEPAPFFENKPPAEEEQPAERAADPLDDLFNDSMPEVEDMPAEGGVAPAEGETPADDPLEGLFSDPVPDDTGMPAGDEAAPAFEDAPAEDPLDNLFGDPVPDDMSMPVEGETPAAEGDAEPAADAFDNLFGDSTPEGDEMPAEDEAETEAEAEPSSDLFDDLFGDPKANDEGEGENDADSDDPFGAVAPKRDHLVQRRWVDNTGHYNINGKLIAILDGKVRILKGNSRTCTVPLGRLSQQDLAYVTRIAMQYGQGEITQLAGR